MVTETLFYGDSRMSCSHFFSRTWVFGFPLGLFRFRFLVTKRCQSQVLLKRTLSPIKQQHKTHWSNQILPTFRAHHLQGRSKSLQPSWCLPFLLTTAFEECPMPQWNTHEALVGLNRLKYIYGFFFVLLQKSLHVTHWNMVNMNLVTGVWLQNKLVFSLR